MSISNTICKLLRRIRKIISFRYKDLSYDDLKKLINVEERYTNIPIERLKGNQLGKIDYSYIHPDFEKVSEE